MGKWFQSNCVYGMGGGEEGAADLSLFLPCQCFFSTLHSQAAFKSFQWQDSRNAGWDIIMKEVTLPSAGHKQKDLISFGLLLIVHISSS